MPREPTNIDFPGRKGYQRLPEIFLVKKEHRPTDKSVGRTFISPPGFNSTRSSAIAFKQVRLWAVVIEALIASTVKVIGTQAIAIEALLG